MYGPMKRFCKLYTNYFFMNHLSFKSVVIILFSLIFNFQSYGQDYPFQNTSLSDDERLDNLISLMTLEEKVNHLSPWLRGIPRLGIKGTMTAEGLHGLARSGAIGQGARRTTTGNGF